MVRHWVGISLCHLRHGAYNISMLGFPNQNREVVPLPILRLDWGGCGQCYVAVGREGWKCSTPHEPGGIYSCV